MFMSKKHSFSSLCSRCNVHLKLRTNSVEVILVHSTIFSVVRVFLSFKNFYSILKFRFTPRFVVEKHHFWTVVRYRKIPPAAAANQIAEKAGIPPLTNGKKYKMCFYVAVPSSKKRTKVSIALNGIQAIYLTVKL